MSCGRLVIFRMQPGHSVSWMDGNQICTDSEYSIQSSLSSLLAYGAYPLICWSDGISLLKILTLPCTQTFINTKFVSLSFICMSFVNVISLFCVGGSVEITVFVTPSKEFFRSGDDIYSCETVSLGKALLGGEIVCRGIDGRQTFVKIQPGQDMINLQGHGLGGRGDHLVQLVVKVSTKPSFIFSSVRKVSLFILYAHI